MVVSAILLATMAPITGALFGASYGTAIRIGYEIIFPALFGDLSRDIKKQTVSREQGAKQTIKALHTMFTLTGGASALEFGISQGIEMAKKKTESPEVQNLINLSLGLTDEQIRRRHLTTSQQVTGTPEQIREAELIASPQPDFAPPAEIDEIRQIKKNYPNTDIGNRQLWTIMERGNAFGRRNTKQKKALIEVYKQRRKEHPALFKSFDNPDVESVITRTSSGQVKQIAAQFNFIQQLVNAMAQYKKRYGSRVTRPGNIGNNYRKIIKDFLVKTKIFNALVQSQRRRELTIDTAKTISTQRIIRRF